MLGKAAHWNRGCCCCNSHQKTRYAEKIQWQREAYDELQEEKEELELQKLLDKPILPQWVLDIIEEELNKRKRE